MLVIKDVGRRLVDGFAELRATVGSGRRALPAQTVWLRYPERYLAGLSSTSDALLPAMLLPAMRLAMPLRIEGAVSAKMMTGAHQFMEIVHKWCRDYRPVPVEADEVRPSRTEGRQVASFFSGGVDSFYTALTGGRAGLPPDRRISTLIFMQGFDVPKGDAEARLTAQAGVSAAAADLGMELLCVDSNLRQVTRRLCRWQYYHGQALASAALGLAGLLGRVYIPSTFDSGTPAPHGSHPLLDPLWSTETLEFVHDGYEVPRTEKVISEISRSPAALAHLRVCPSARGSTYNCGRCASCLRAKINLTIAGVLDQCRTLDPSLDYGDIARLAHLSSGGRILAKDNLQAAIAHGADPRLIRALRQSLSPSARLMPRYWPHYARAVSRAFRGRLLGGILEKATWQRWLKE